MTNLIDDIVMNIIQMGSNSISRELVKNIVCVSENINEIGQETVPI